MAQIAVHMLQADKDLFAGKDGRRRAVRRRFFGLGDV